MNLFTSPQPATAPAPWFRRHPIVAMTVAGVLFAAIMSVRLIVRDPLDASSMLYVLPVALVAVTFGLRSGLAAGLFGIVLLAIWGFLQHVSLSPLGWGSRIVPLLLLGILLGDASDRLRRAEAQGRRLAAASLLQREAVEVNDSLVQGMVAAKWSLEAKHVDASLKILDETIISAQELVSDLIRRSNSVQQEPGRVTRLSYSTEFLVAKQMPQDG
jgi:glucose-6-phosphate-specific signal transduction histidine kinase